jgi:outer membrane protein TolC
LQNARLMLARWTGETADRPLGALPPIDRIRLARANLEAQLTHHPELSVLARQEDIAASDVLLARANRRSDWTVEVAYQQRGSAYSNMVSVGVAIPLQWDRGSKQDRELAARLATAAQAHAEREETVRTHVAATLALMNEWDSGRARMARFAGEILPLAHSRTEATLVAYRGGKASLADVVGARRSELEVRLQALQLEADTARTWVQLEFLFPTHGESGTTSPTSRKDIK